MRELREPPLPVTFWPHALLQMLVFVIYMLVLEPMGIFPTVQSRVLSMELHAGWGLPFLLWMGFIFLIVETSIRLSMNWAASVFPFHRFAYILLRSILLLPMLYVCFVGLECVLFFIVMGRYPVYFGVINFNQGFGLTLIADLPFLLVLGLGELFRAWLYQPRLQQWYHEWGLRRLPNVDSE